MWLKKSENKFKEKCKPMYLQPLINQGLIQFYTNLSDLKTNKHLLGFNTSK